MSVAASLDLKVDDAVVLNDSNRLLVRLLPCDVVARVSPHGWFSASREVDLARRLRELLDAPVAELDPRVEPRVHERDGFEISLWSYFESVDATALAPTDYARALERLHAALRQVDMAAPHFADRFVQIEGWLADPAFTPDLTHEDRELLADRITGWKVLMDGATSEQVLHGEPHPWNVLVANGAPLFIDFENCARGPVEYDLAWVPKAVSDRYPDADQGLVGECRGLVLALITAHRWRRDDQHPSGREGGVAFLNAVRHGPPWRPDEVTW